MTRLTRSVRASKVHLWQQHISNSGSITAVGKDQLIVNIFYVLHISWWDNAKKLGHQTSGPPSFWSDSKYRLLASDAPSMQGCCWRPTSCRKPRLENWLHFALFTVQPVIEKNLYIAFGGKLQRKKSCAFKLTNTFPTDFIILHNILWINFPPLLQTSCNPKSF